MNILVNKQKNRTSVRTQYKGFTIVELLTVIVIISILATLSLVAYNGITNRAHETTLKTDLSNSASKLEIAQARKRQYPDTIDTLDLQLGKGNILAYYTNSDSSKYCVQAMHENVDTHYITNKNKTPQKGTCGTFLVAEEPPTPPAPPAPPIPANCNEYSNGDTGPGEGVIVYTASSPQSWGCYIEAANTGGWWHVNSEPTFVWGCRDQDISTPTTGYGQGMENTMNIADNCTEYTAADKARSFNGGGLGDWYLPNKDEIDRLMDFQTELGIKNGADWMAATYWTSNQKDASMGVNYLTHGTACFFFCVTVEDGFLAEYKDNSILKYVRPIRKF